METTICPKCGCNKFFIAVIISEEEELHECAYCKELVNLLEIRKKHEDKISNCQNPASV